MIKDNSFGERKIPSVLNARRNRFCLQSYGLCGAGDTLPFRDPGTARSGALVGLCPGVGGSPVGRGHTVPSLRCLWGTLWTDDICSSSTFINESRVLRSNKNRQVGLGTPLCLHRGAWVFIKEKQLGKTRTKIRLQSQQPSFVFYQTSIIVINGGRFS